MTVVQYDLSFCYMVFAGGLAELPQVDPQTDPDGSRRKRWLLKRQREIFGIDEGVQKWGAWNARTQIYSMIHPSSLPTSIIVVRTIYVYLNSHI